MFISEREPKKITLLMAEENRVVLHGMWASPVVKRVELALKIKGIPFEYVEEDVNNKSPELIKFNPVYKKVPVLIHNGKPISESLVILEYIEEVWKNYGPPLLPQDPYKRAQIRFWAEFISKQLLEGLVSVMKTEGETQEKCIKEVREMLKMFEEHGLKSLLGEGKSPFVNGHELGFLDMVAFPVLGFSKIQEEFFGIKLVEEEKIPIVFSWLTKLTEHPITKEIAAPKEKIMWLLQLMRQKALQSPAI